MGGAPPSSTILEDSVSWCSRLTLPRAQRYRHGAVPDQIILVPGLPKTRSGKIMRRILRKIAEGELDALEDLTTLAFRS